jgi:hypothetical protein
MERMSMKRRVIFRARRINRYYSIIPTVSIYSSDYGDWAIDFAFLVWRFGFIFEKVF